MSLDLFSGSLARYYSRDFETPQARYARENGLNYKLIYTEDEPRWLTPTEAPNYVEKFRGEIADQINPNIETDWREDVSQYFVEQLFEEALDSLILVAAYQMRTDLKRPKRTPAHIENDPAYSESVEQEYYLGPMAILEATLWLPGEEDVQFSAKDPMMWDVNISSTGNLKRALENLANTVWNGNVDVDAWFSRGVAPGKGIVKRKRKIRLPRQSEFVEEREREPENSLIWNAEYAFSVFWRAVEFSQENRCPIRTDS